MTATDKERAILGLPPRVFFYTLGQVGAIIEMSEADVLKKVVYLEGREVGRKMRGQLQAINVARGDHTPEWRVEDAELIRWLRHKKIRRFDRGA